MLLIRPKKINKYIQFFFFFGISVSSVLGFKQIFLFGNKTVQGTFIGKFYLVEPVVSERRARLVN